MSCAWLLAALLFLSPVPDIIHLKNGGRVEGKIVEEGPSSLLVETKLGRIRIDRERIREIEKGPWVVEEFREMWAQVDRSDPVALEKLLDWCLEPSRRKKLVSESRKVARRLLRLDKDHAAAHRVMGHVRFEGRWLTRGEAKRRREEIARAKAEAREKAAAEAARAREEKERLALIGGLSIAEQVAENRETDRAEERLLRDQHALDFRVRSSRRISVKGVLEEKQLLHFLALGEKMCGTLNKELGRPVASSPFRKAKHERLHFFVVDPANFADTLRYVDGTYTQYDAAFLNYSLKRQAGVTADGDGCVGIQINGQEHNEDVFCHYFGHAYVESIGRRVGHWFTEGFAVYCAIRFHGNAVHLCTTQARYAQHVEEGERQGVSIMLGFVERAEKERLPSVRQLFKKHMNRLDEADLAKSWGTVSFFMAPERRRRFLEYLETMPTVGGKHEEALRAVFGWAPEELDAKVMAWRPKL